MAQLVTSLLPSDASGSYSETTLRVRYAETDQMGIVYHSHYIIWFEVGRVELLRQLGFEYKMMEIEDECYIAVVDVRCRYRAPARYDDEIAVRTRLKHLRSSIVQFSYEVIRRSDNTLLAEGETTHVVTDSKLQRKPLPEKYASAFRAFGAPE